MRENLVGRWVEKKSEHHSVGKEIKVDIYLEEK